MATFGKRAQPKHRADPGDRRRTPSSAASPGAHAASTPAAPAPATPDAPAPTVPEVVAPEVAAPAPAPVEPTPAPAESPAPAPELESTPLELPAAPVPVSEPVSEPASQPVSQPEPPSAEPGQLRVLIVDDNEDVRGLLRIAFARADIEVVGAASDFREALAMAQRGGPGIILLDVNLPGMAGLDLLPQLLERCPRAKVVMFSAQVSSQVTEAAMARGAVGFVEKGVSMKNVITHLRDVARAPEAQVVEPFPLKVYA